jgi:hypothetical protein
MIEPRAIVRGRCGGANRERFALEIAKYTKNPGYEYDEDCSMDDTFAFFVFTIQDTKKWLDYITTNQKLATYTQHNGESKQCTCIDAEKFKEKTEEQWIKHWHDVVATKNIDEKARPKEKSQVKSQEINTKSSLADPTHKRESEQAKCPNGCDADIIETLPGECSECGAQIGSDIDESE